MNARENFGQPPSGSAAASQQDILGDTREPKKTGLRSRLGLGHTLKDSGQSDQGKLYNKGLGRTASIKRKDNISLISANSLSTDQISLPNQISSGHSSVQLSPGLPNQEKIGLDPFLVQPDHPRQSISLASSSSHQSSIHQQPEHLPSITNQHSHKSSRTQDIQGKSLYLHPADLLVRQSQENAYEPYNYRDTQQSIRHHNSRAYQSSNLPDHQPPSSASAANQPETSSSQPQASPYLSQYRQYQPQNYGSPAQDYSGAREDESFYDSQRKPNQYQQRDEHTVQQPNKTNQLLELKSQYPPSRPQSQSRNASFPTERTSSRQQAPSFIVQGSRSQAETASSDSMRTGMASGRAGEDPSSSQRSQSTISGLQSPPQPSAGYTGAGGSSTRDGGPYNRSGSKLSNRDENGGRQTPSQLPTATDLTEEEVTQVVKKSNEYKALRRFIGFTLKHHSFH